jgi:hypothetical protein
MAPTVDGGQTQDSILPMTDAIVQLFREGLSCVKDLELFQSSILSDPSYTATFYDFHEPLNKTTPLEVIISLLQLHAVLYGTHQGWTMVVANYEKIGRIVRLMDVRKPVKSEADRLVNANLIKEMTLAIRSLFVGINLFVIGFCFFWIFGDSWHVTETDWMGGDQALIHALTLMEICLLPLLYYMWKDASERFIKTDLIKVLAAKMQNGTLTQEDMGLTSFEMMSGWVPFWNASVGLLEEFDASKEEKLMAQEVAKVEEMLKVLVGKKGDGEREVKVVALLAGVGLARLEGYRDYFYFVLNCIAFYGYLVGIVVYYWSDEMEQPAWVHHGLLLGMNNTRADWTGNFVGDLMWTMEGAVILGSRSLLGLIKPKLSKSKLD